MLGPGWRGGACWGWVCWGCPPSPPPASLWSSDCSSCRDSASCSSCRDCSRCSCFWGAGGQLWATMKTEDLPTLQVQSLLLFLPKLLIFSVSVSAPVQNQQQQQQHHHHQQVGQQVQQSYQEHQASSGEEQANVDSLYAPALPDYSHNTVDLTQSSAASRRPNYVQSYGKWWNYMSMSHNNNVKHQM